MALSGSFQNLCMSSNRCGIVCTWSATQSVIGNYSDVTVNTYLRVYDLDLSSRTLTSNINGDTAYITIAAIKDTSSKLHDIYLNSRTVRVYHNANGVANGIPLSVTYDFRASYANQYFTSLTAETTIDLNIIDRSAPTINLSLSNVTSSSVMLTATSNVPVNVWEYSIDNWTSWITIPTAGGTSLSYTITGLSPNTEYNIYVRAEKTSNEVYGISNACYVRTVGNTLLNSVNTLTVDIASPILTMNWTVYANYTHSLVIKDGTTPILTISGLTCSIGTNNKTITLNAEQRKTILEYMADKSSFTATFELRTYSGNSQIGAAAVKTATIQTTASTSAPSFTDFVHKDSNTDKTVAITDNDQVYIKGYSLLQIEIGEASAKNEAFIESYRVTVGSDIKEFYSSPIDYGVMGITGDNITLKVEVIDSRGFSTAISKTITVIDYTEVSITEYTIRRKNEVEPTVQLAFSGNISPIIVDGETRNGVVSAKFRYAPNGGDWSGWNKLTVSETTQTFEFATLALSNSSGILEFDPNAQYSIEVKVEDCLSSDIMPMILNKGTPLVAFRQKKVGINEPNPTAALHIRGEGDLLKLNDMTIQQFILETIYPVGSIYTSVSATSPDELFGGEWEQIENRFLLACGSEYEAGSIGGEAKHTLTIAEMPKHAHNDGADADKGIDAPIGDTSAITYYTASNGTRGTTEAGGDQPHNNMPPYIAVYMWKRIN